LENEGEQKRKIEREKENQQAIDSQTCLLLQQLSRDVHLAATHRESTLLSEQSRAEQARGEKAIHVWSPGAIDLSSAYNEHTLPNPKNQGRPILPNMKRCCHLVSVHRGHFRIHESSSTESRKFSDLECSVAVFYAR